MRYLMILALSASFLLAGCGDTPEEKAEEGNKKIAQINATSKALYFDHDVNVITRSADEASLDRDYDLDELKVIEGKLASIVNLIDQVFKLAEDDRVKLKSKSSLLNRRAIAVAYLDVVRAEKKVLIEIEQQEDNQMEEAI